MYIFGQSLVVGAGVRKLGVPVAGIIYISMGVDCVPNEEQISLELTYLDKCFSCGQISPN